VLIECVEVEILNFQECGNRWKHLEMLRREGGEII
jgi:hypothetical protein